MASSDFWVGTTTRFNAWRGRAAPGAVANLIAESPSEITVDREGVLQAPQTVRIDLATLRVMERLGIGANALVNKQWVVILGYQNHPLIDDTDLVFGDRFFYADQWFVVKKVELVVTDRLLALAEGDGG